ncbi:MAG: spore coat protein [Syntrophomonadales bacterium]|jgi:spore coat protein CotF
MLKDRDIASDCIEMHKHGAIDLTRMALECDNPQLRQTFITMRNKCEQSQNELAQIATSKGWYVPSPGADPSEINQVSQSLSQIVGY